MKIIAYIIILCFWVMPKIGQSQPPNFNILDYKGKKTNFDALLKAALKADVVFFGERHNDSLAHALELSLAVAMHKANKTKFLVGMEMFETDNQMIIDEYIAGLCSERSFEAEAKLWPNYQTDYKPILTYCKAENIAMVATNVPRRYASLSAQRGISALSGLSAPALKLMAPLPFAYDSSLLAYAFLGGGDLANHANYMPMAQALKDATMAWSISNFMVNGAKMLHINGSFHSDYNQGIVWHLKKYRPELKVLVVSIKQNAGLAQVAKDKTKLGPIADFILVSDDK